MNNIDEILDSLQAKQPEISNEEELTDLVIRRIDEQMSDSTKSFNSHKTSAMIIALRTISSIAASILILLFLSVKKQSTDASAQTNSYANIIDQYITDYSSCRNAKEVFSLYMEQQMKSEEINKLKKKLYEKL